MRNFGSNCLLCRHHAASHRQKQLDSKTIVQYSSKNVSNALDSKAGCACPYCHIIMLNKYTVCIYVCIVVYPRILFLYIYIHISRLICLQTRVRLHSDIKLYMKICRNTISFVPIKVSADSAVSESFSIRGTKDASKWAACISKFAPFPVATLSWARAAQAKGSRCCSWALMRLSPVRDVEGW